MKAEEELQAHIIRWFDVCYPDYAPLLFHVPNGGYRTTSEASRLKALGVRAGVADLILLKPCNHLAFLCMELKTAKGTVSKKQQQWHALISNSTNGFYVVVRDIKKAKEILTHWVEGHAGMFFSAIR